MTTTEAANLAKIWRALRAQLAACGLVLISGAVHAADISKGGELYSVHCASCHGTSGVSVMPDAPSFEQSDVLLQSDFMLLNAIRNGKNAMPAYQGILNDREILDVIAYLRTLN